MPQYYLDIQDFTLEYGFVKAYKRCGDELFFRHFDGRNPCNCRRWQKDCTSMEEFEYWISQCFVVPLVDKGL